jgi:mRNA interferase RelE/StbE
VENNEEEWGLKITSKAEKKISSLPADEQAHVRDILKLLVTDPKNADVKRMKGADKGKFRQRVGKWRALFRFDHEDKKVVVTDFGSRGDVYK